MHRPISLLLSVAAILTAQTPKDIREVAKGGQLAVPKVAAYLTTPALDTRLEVVKQLIALGGRDSVDGLIQATRDNDPEMQMRATDGLVNYYLPGYVKQGPAATLTRAGATIRAKFSDSNDQIVDAFVAVREDVIAALGQLVRGGNGMDVRANACRAVGILRGKAAIPDLLEALRTKDNAVMYESLAAITKIGDPSAGPRIVYLLRDLDDKVQSAALEAAGVLRATDGLPALRSVVANPRNQKSERAALFAIAMMPEPADRGLLQRYIASKDDKLRAAALEGLGRAGDGGSAAVQNAWRDDEKMSPRLASAFALVLSGKVDVAESSPLRYLINQLNTAAWRETASAYLMEAARKPEVRAALYEPLEAGTRDEKIQLSRVLAASGDAASVPYLDKISKDTDTTVAAEGLRSLRSLKARL